MLLAERLRAEYTDPYDTPLYEMAAERFRADLIRYNVTQRKCEELKCSTPKTKAFFAAALTMVRDEHSSVFSRRVDV